MLNIKQQAEDFLKSTGHKASDVVALSATPKADIETSCGTIKVLVNRFLPSEKIYLVNRADFTKEWLMPDAPTNRI